MESLEIINLFPKASEYPGYQLDVKTFSKNDFSIVYVGGTHSEDPENPMFDFIEKEWNSFPEATHILTEVSNKLSPNVKDKESAINEGIESGFIQFLAKQRDSSIKWISMDLNGENRVRYFLKLGYSVKEIFPLELFRRVSSGIKVTGLENLSKDFLETSYDDKSRLFSAMDLSGVPTLNEIKGMYHEFANLQEIDYDWASPIAEYSSPPLAGLVNKMAKVVHDARDVNMVETILRYSQPRNHLFVVATHFHLWTQWPALESLLERTY